VRQNTEKALIELAAVFLKIRDLACPEIKGKPCKTWDDFTEAIPDLFCRLKKDAIAIFKK
jgi:serine O-acetyltransferase